MPLQVQARGLSELRVRLTAMQQRAKDLGPALSAAAIYTRDQAILRIKNQGGDQHWVPNKRGGHTGIDTGRMWQSIGISQSGPGSITVGTNVRYAAWFQYGTGTYAGHSAWTIYPTKKKALAFTVGGVTYVRRSVVMQGQPKRPFLLFTDDNRTRIRAIFLRYLDRGKA